MKQQTIDLTDFMEHAVETSSNPRIRRWGRHVVIHGDGQVRFHEAILNRLLTHENSGGRLPPDPRVLIGCPDEKTIIFQFVSLEYVESDEFKAAFRARHADASGTESASGPNVDFECAANTSCMCVFFYSHSCTITMRRPAATLQPEQEHGVTANYQTSWQRRWRRLMRPPWRM